MFEFKHVDTTPGLNETHTKRYRFHAHAMRPELSLDLERTRPIVDTNLIMIVA
jgi:hypothetical protein